MIVYSEINFSLKTETTGRKRYTHTHTHSNINKNTHTHAHRDERARQRALKQTKTYGFRKIIRKVASEPRCKRVPNASRTCSFAAVCSSDVGCPPPVPSSSTLNRYKKHLSLNGCSLFTVVCVDFARLLRWIWFVCLFVRGWIGSFIQP